MARVGRLAGAILAETEGSYYLVGNTKGPCDFAAHGFSRPAEIDALARPYLALSPLREVAVPPPLLILGIEGEGLARILARRFLIERNGSVSDRLWHLVLDPSGQDRTPDEVTEAGWLGAMPEPIWNIVRERVLKCS